MTLDIRALNKMLDEFGPTVQKANDVPVPETLSTQTIGDGLARPYGNGYQDMSDGDSMLLQRSLNGLSKDELGYLLGKQIQKGMGTGVPLSAWQSNQWGAQNPVIQNALDTSGGGALIRQDLDPFLISMFVKRFPAWQRIRKVQANGVVHAWDQLTSYGDSASSFITELGTVVDKTGTYVRKTTNIAVYGQRRGVTFKQQLAVPAGGMAWDSARIEIENGLTQMAHDLQKTIFQGNSTDSGGTAANELGLYDPNAFDGLRKGLSLSPDTGVNFNPYYTSSPDNFVVAFNKGITTIADAVGVAPTVVYSRYAELGQLSNQQLSIQRAVNTMEFIPGVQVPALMTSAGELPVVPIPGDAIGTYVTGGKTVADMYFINEDFLEVAYLGSPGPSVIEIPPGVSGQLTRLYIVWGMFGLAITSTAHSAKARVNQALS